MNLIALHRQRYAKLFIALTVFASIVNAAIELESINNACKNKDNCRDCIQTSNCAWCKVPNFTEDRCFQSNSNSTCTSIEFPVTKKVEEISLPLTGNKVSEKKKNDKTNVHKIVQLMPQYMKLELKPNEAYDFTLKYARALDYPVDLYYLMDLSESMRDDRDNLSILGDMLAKTMRNITADFRLGFGSFIDKAIMPFTNIVLQKWNCRADEKCNKPYSYRNVMPLSTNTDEFSLKVKNARISPNSDSPEGGLDAMIQAIVCRKEIGWREKARHLLVFSTDADFHSAGDGKLAGLIQPNDAKCHLDSEGYYTHAEKLDYPSVGMIKHVIKENSINVIFAVTKDVLEIYKQLSDRIEGSKTAILTGQSSNVVNLIREQYQQISSSIEMSDNSTGNVKITYYSSCRGNGPEIPTSKCDGLRVDEEIEFKVNIRVTSCPADPRDWQQTIQIYPIGINESLIIDLEMLCGCKCEAEENKKSKYCSSKGSLMCGVCECDEKFVGAKCQCSNTEHMNSTENSHNCRDNSMNIDCSGRGVCSCGQCQCDKRNNDKEVISGKYCQCDNFSCERSDQKLCSGSDHGKCECGNCVCNDGWQGKACECPVSTESCRKPGDDKLCSGKGECECGVCKCQSTAQGRFSGKYCETCPTCSSLCSELKDCVQCQMYKRGKFQNEKDCLGNCTQVETIAVDKVREKFELVEGEKNCEFFDDCIYAFTFKENDGLYKIEAQKERKCAPKIAFFKIAISVSSSILLTGLATLLMWKIITTMQDRREYKRFEAEKLNAKWNSGGNPLYKQATTSFKNPTYSNNMK
ncbi:integrin beta-PS [Ceratitis capitata]|uniref:integrin beta-PS n=1 Tax=Ceratitis capitata TaxID=7213 RepID=UPI00032A3422|nr:integrin beta-PS [Ceratitis capitata]